jgi:hypothetical protein
MNGSCPLPGSLPAAGLDNEPDLARERLGQGGPPRRRRGHPRAGGRRGDLPHVKGRDKCVAATVQRCIRWRDEKGPRAGPFSLGGQPGCGWLASDLGER